MGIDRQFGVAVVSDKEEVVLGRIPVIAQLTLGSQRLNLFFTDTRIIMADVGKRGAGSVTATSFLGKLGDAFEDLLKGGKESVGKRKLETLRPSEILSLDKDNFAIGYDEVISVDLEETEGPTQIIMVTSDGKFQFSTLIPVQRVEGLLKEKLETKITVRRLRESGSTDTRSH